MGDTPLLVLQAQEQPAPGTALSDLITVLDVLFTLMFLIDLLINFWVHFFWRFARNGWNLFDLLIVLVSIISLINHYTANDPHLVILRFA